MGGRGLVRVRPGSLDKAECAAKNVRRWAYGCKRGYFDCTALSPVATRKNRLKARVLRALNILIRKRQRKRRRAIIPRTETARPYVRHHPRLLPPRRFDLRSLRRRRHHSDRRSLARKKSNRR